MTLPVSEGRLHSCVSVLLENTFNMFVELCCLEGKQLSMLVQCLLWYSPNCLPCDKDYRHNLLVADSTAMSSDTQSLHWFAKGMKIGLDLRLDWRPSKNHGPYLPVRPPTVSSCCIVPLEKENSSMYWVTVQEEPRKRESSNTTAIRCASTRIKDENARGIPTK